MAKRHNDALAISEGACNPRAIVNAVRSAIDALDNEANIEGTFKMADTPAICNDPAIRLMVYQLAYITHAIDFERSLMAYTEACDACRAKQGAQL